MPHAEAGFATVLPSAPCYVRGGGKVLNFWRKLTPLRQIPAREEPRWVAFLEAEHSAFWKLCKTEINLLATQLLADTLKWRDTEILTFPARKGKFRRQITPYDESQTPSQKCASEWFISSKTNPCAF
jgi:hypothetical protein